MNIGDHIQFTSTRCRGLVTRSLATKDRTGGQPSLFTSSVDLTPMAMAMARSPPFPVHLEMVAEVI
jgi:hypothetical protein